MWVKIVSKADERRKICYYEAKLAEQHFVNRRKISSKKRHSVCVCVIKGNLVVLYLQKCVKKASALVKESEGVDFKPIQRDFPHNIAQAWEENWVFLESTVWVWGA